MRKTLFRLSMIAFALLGMQSTLTAQEKTPLNQVVNTLKERISLAGYAQLGYTYDIDNIADHRLMDRHGQHIFFCNSCHTVYRLK